MIAGKHELPENAVLPFVNKSDGGYFPIHKPLPVLLVFPFGLLSHYLRCLVLVRHIKPYYQILFAHQDKYASFIAKEGFGTFRCLSLDPDKVLACVKKFNFSWINEKDMEPVYLDQVKTIDRYMPVAVLGDTSPTLKMAAEKTGVKYISLMNGYMSKYYALSRKISKTHPAYPLIKLLPGSIANYFTRKGEALAFYKIHEPFKKIRKRNALNQKFTYTDELEGDVNLLCDLTDLFPLNKLPGNYKVIPPLYYESAPSGADIRKRLDKTRKTIFIRMGSSGDWEKVLFLNHPYFEKYNLVTANDSENMISANHVINTDFINTQELFPFTDLVICHGGNGTIYQALLYGIPVLSKPSHLEQEWNVDAIERAGAGRSLDEVSNLEELFHIVEEWVEKKDNDTLRFYKNKIKQQEGKLKNIVQDVMLHLNSNPVAGM